MNDNSVRLTVTEDDAYLQYLDRGRMTKVRPEWKSRKGRDLLARAIGHKKGRRLSVLDGTLGLAGDAIHLHSLGHGVTGIERNEVVFQLVQWWLQKNNISMEVVNAETAQWLRQASRHFDVIYLDPMFPHESGKSARSRKTMDVLQRLSAASTYDEETFREAIQHAARIVVKRPLRALPLVDNPQPSFGIKGKLIRYDIYQM